MVKTHSFLVTVVFLAKLLFPPALLADQAEKIISIGASITEMISGLGLQDRIIAVDSTSAHASEKYSSLPNVGYQRNLSAEGLLSLAPDMIIGTTDMGPDSVVNQLKNSGVELVLFEPAHSVLELKQTIAQLSGLLLENPQSHELTNVIDQQTETLMQLKKSTEKQRALFFLSYGKGAPRVSGSGTIANALINSLGFTNAADYDGYRVLSSESIIALNPEVILILDTRAKPVSKQMLMNMLPGIESTKAMVNDKLSMVTGSSLSGGYGPDIVNEMIRILNNLGFNNQSNQLAVNTLAIEY